MPPRVVNQFMAKIFVLYLLLAFYNKYADKNCRPTNLPDLPLADDMLGPIMKIPTMVIGFATGHI